MPVTEARQLRVASVSAAAKEGGAECTASIEPGPEDICEQSPLMNSILNGNSEVESSWLWRGRATELSLK